MASLEPELMDFLPEAVPPLSIVLINDQLPWTADLISATNQDSIAIAYDGNDFSNRQLLDLLASTLSDHTAEQIESVSLFAHGNAGIVYLADNLAWTTDTLSADRELFRELDALLTDDASIYLYSCSVAGSADGKLFIEQLGTLTNSTVYASDDPVGNTDTADWDWEYVTGADVVVEIESHTFQSISVPALHLLGDAYEKNLGFGNNFFNAAFYLGAGGSFFVNNLDIYNPSDVDWYSFYLDQDGTAEDYVQIDFSHSVGDLELELYDHNQNLLNFSYTATDNERIILSGRSGESRYYLAVFGYAGATSPYGISIEAQPHQFAGDWKEDNDAYATVLPSVTTPGINVSGLSLHNADDVDWFQFDLQATATSAHYVYAYDFLTDNTDLDINLFDVNYNLIDYSRSASDSEFINLETLTYGTYYVSIYSANESFNQATGYTLEIVGPVPPEVDRFESNNTFQSATYLGQSGTVLWDLFIPESDGDVFELDLPVNGSADDFVAISFSHTQSDLGLALYDSNGELVRYSNSLTDFENVDFSGLSSGTFYAYVYGTENTDAGSYELIYSPPLPLSPDEYEPNSSSSEAYDFGIISIPADVSGLSIHQANNDDWFRFDLTDWGTSRDFAEIAFKNEQGNIGLALHYLYDGQVHLLNWSNGFDDTERISLDGLPPWTYYIQVYGNGQTNSNYKLTIDPPSDILPDRFEPNSPEATPLGTIERDVALSNLSIHDDVDIDFFEFAIANKGTDADFIAIDFEHARGDLDLYLYDSNSQIIRSSEFGTDDEFISLDQLPAATYFLGVMGYKGATNPYYNLTVAPPLEPYYPVDYLDKQNANNTLANATKLHSHESDVLIEPQTLDSLTIHDSTDLDFFEFTTAGTGTASNTLWLQYDHEDGDIDFSLLNSSGQLLASGTELTNYDVISLGGLAAGKYYLVVSGDQGAKNNYTLSLNVPRSAVAAENVNDWTIMVYMTASNLTAAAIQDINEMEKAVSQLPGSVEIAVLWDQSSNSTWVDGEGKVRLHHRAATGNGSQPAWGTTGRAIIQPDNDLCIDYYGRPSLASCVVATTFEILGEQNTGDPTTLTSFINWASETAPANNYALVLWDHGGGLDGFNFDDEDGPSTDELYADELVAALDAANPSFDLVAFDACFMGSLETAYLLRDLTDVFVASQDAEDGTGYDYTTAFSVLRDNPEAVTSDMLSSSIVSSFQRQYYGNVDQYGRRRGNDTHSAIRTSNLEAVAGDLKTFSDNLLNASPSEIRTASSLLYDVAHFKPSGALNVDVSRYMDAVDATSGLPSALRQAAKDTATAVNQSVIANAANLQNATGLSIYSDPFLWPIQSSNHYSRFKTFYDATNWHDALDAMSAQADPWYYSEDWAGNNYHPGNAYPLNELSGTNELYGLHLNRRDTDWFSFRFAGTVTDDHYVRIIPYDGTVPVQIGIYDQTVSVLRQSNTATGAQTVSLKDLVQGRYLLRVTTDEGAALAGYALQIVAPTPEDTYNWSAKNDVSTKAFDLGIIGGQIAFNGNHLDANESDWFFFGTPVSTSTIPSNLRIAPVDGKAVTATIYDEDGDVVQSIQGTTTFDVSYTPSGSAEFYMLQIVSGNSATSYHMVFAPAPIANTDQYATDEDTTLFVSSGNGVLFNDGLPNTNNVSLIVVDDPIHGSVTLNSVGAITYIPDTNYSGQDSFTYFIEDGIASSNLGTVLLDILPVNDLPTLAALANLTLAEDATEQTVNLAGITAGGGESQPLRVTTTSSNTSLLADPTVTYTSAESTGTIKFTPLPDQHGSTTITVTVEDAGLDGKLETADDNSTSSQTFNVTVSPVNDTPTLSAIANITVAEDASEQTVNLEGITAGGGESQPLRVTATSSNTTLIADPTVTYTSGASTGTLKFTPIADQHGSNTITVTVEDGGLDNNLQTADDNAISSQTFNVTVSPVNDTPTLSAIANITLNEDASEQTVNLAGIVAGGGELQPLHVTATSSNTSLIADPTVTYTSAESTGTIKFTPILDQFGSTTITVTVEDAGLDGKLETADDNATSSQTFNVTVSPVNDTPTLDAIASITLNEDASEQTVNLAGITAGGGESQPLRVTATSSNTDLIANPAVTYTSAESTGSLAFTPASNRSGTATITVTVQDAGPDGDIDKTDDNATTTQTFTVTVRPVNNLPTLAALSNLTLDEDADEQTVNLASITAGGGESQALRVTATSSNTSLIADPTVTYTSAEAAGSLKFTPVSDESGSAVITVTVEDGGLDGDLSSTGDNATTTQTFTVTVRPVNDVPTLVALANLILTEDADEQTVSLSGITAGGGESQPLRVTVTSSGSGSFGPAMNFTAGTGPQSVSIADFNGDGNQDLAVANQLSHDVSILLGTGSGSFAAATNFAVGDYPLSVAVADFNGDGKQDLATTIRQSDNVSILLGDGSGSFSAPTNFAVGNSPEFVSVGDLNGDGNQDLAVANFDDANVSILLGDGSGSFAAATSFAVGSGPVSIAMADVNGDGNQDLAVVNVGPDNVSVLLGDGSGSFAAATTFAVGLDPFSIAVADFNGDGNQDLAVANINNNNVSILLGDGSGSFSAATNFAVGSGPKSVAVADFNGDGNHDLAVTNSNNDNNVSILLGDGSGSFSAATNFAVGEWPKSVSVGDFNDDGKQDLAVANGNPNETSVSILLGEAGIAPSPAVTYTSAESIGFIKFTPKSDASGSAVITVTVEDGGLDGDLATSEDNGTVSRQFEVNVSALPTLDSLTDLTIDEDATEQTVNLAGITAGDSESQPLRVTATSSNTSLMADPTVTYTSAESTGTIKFTPILDQHGSTTITVTVEDGGLDNNLQTADDNAATSQTFDVTVNPANDHPSLAAIANLTIDEDAAEQTVSISDINAGGGELQPLHVTATSSNNSLIADPTVTYTSGASTGTLKFTPIADQHGSNTITVTVEDGGLDNNLQTADDNAATSQTFDVTVNPANDHPSLAAIANLTIDEDAAEQIVSISDINAGGGELQPLHVTATSSNNSLIADPTVTYTSGASTGTLKFTPIADQHGSTTITVTVEDGGLDNDLDTASDNATFSRTFDVIVNPMNDDPIATDILYRPRENLRFDKDKASGLDSIVTEVDEDDLTFSLVAGPSDGQLVLNEDGSFHYTPDTNFNRTDSFTYVANDGTVDSNIGTVTLKIDTDYTWYNCREPRDVNGDSLVTPLDALWIINTMNSQGSHPLAKARPEGIVKPFLDVNHDGYATPLDALWVINYLNQRSFGEGERASETPAAALAIDRLMSEQAMRRERLERASRAVTAFTGSVSQPVLDNTPYWQRVDETFDSIIRPARRSQLSDAAADRDELFEQSDWLDFLGEDEAF